MKLTASILLVLSLQAFGHVPVLLLPLESTPISSYFIGQSYISRAIFSELTNPGDIFIVQFYVEKEEALIQSLTPVCPSIPQYETFQPTVLIVKGDTPCRKSSESSSQYIRRLEAASVAKAESNYSLGRRSQYDEDHAKQKYWVGGEWRGKLTPDLFKYVDEIMPKKRPLSSAGLHWKIKFGSLTDESISG